MAAIAMRGERALITGGAGAVGSNIADELVRAGAREIVVLDNLVRGRRRSFHAMQELDYAALRYFNVYRPQIDIHGVYTEVLVRWMERIAAGEAPLILGDGSQTMDFIYVEDVARANLLAAHADVTD